MKIRKLSLGIAAGAGILAILVGGEPSVPAWQVGGVSHWCGGEDGPGSGYVAVRMHSLPGGASIAEIQDGRQEADPAGGGRLNMGLNADPMFGAPPAAGRSLVRPRYDDVEDTSLFGETDPSAKLETRSGWGWLADDVMKRKNDEGAAAREDIRQPGDNNMLIDELRGTGTERQSDPYAELYDSF